MFSFGNSSHFYLQCQMLRCADDDVQCIKEVCLIFKLLIPLRYSCYAKLSFIMEGKNFFDTVLKSGVDVLLIFSYNFEQKNRRIYFSCTCDFLPS